MKVTISASANKSVVHLENKNTMTSKDNKCSLKTSITMNSKRALDNMISLMNNSDRTLKTSMSKDNSQISMSKVFKMDNSMTMKHNKMIKNLKLKKTENLKTLSMMLITSLMNTLERKRKFRNSINH